MTDLLKSNIFSDSGMFFSCLYCISVYIAGIALRLFMSKTY